MYDKIILGTGTKKILLLGGIHGNEITPIYALDKLIQNQDAFLDKSKFQELRILNAINTTGIQANTRDTQNTFTYDLNRRLSIDDDIDIDIDAKLKECIDNSDVIIDIHSSPSCTEFVLLNQDEHTNSYVDFCTTNDIAYLIRFSGNNTIKKYGLDLGKISFTIELNKVDMIDFESADKGIVLIQKIIDNIEAFDNKISKPVHKTYKEWTYYKDGIFIPEQKIGDIVNVIQGDLLDIKTGKTETIIDFLDSNHRVILSSDRTYLTPNTAFYFLQPI